MGLAKKAFKKRLRQIALKKPVASVYVITEPIENHGILEIYNYNELLQPYYRKMHRRLKIVGFASSRGAAVKVVSNILEDITRQIGEPDVKSYFGFEG